jgi:hypothetical protein
VLVHVPKCGSTFCLSMARAQCPWAFATPPLAPVHNGSDAMAPAAAAAAPLAAPTPSNGSKLPGSFCSAFDEVFLSQGCARLRSLSGLPAVSPTGAAAAAALAAAGFALPPTSQAGAGSLREPGACAATTLKDHGPLTDDLLAALLPHGHNQGGAIGTQGASRRLTRSQACNALCVSCVYLRVLFQPLT